MKTRVWNLIALIPAAIYFVGCSPTPPAETDQEPPVPAQQQSDTNPQASNSAASATTANLSQQLAEAAAERSSKASPEQRELFQKGIDQVRESGIVDSAKQVGDSAVDGELKGWDGEAVKLSELWQEGPIVLMWYRGGWCPYCNLQLRAMQQSLVEIENAGARLVVLTPELPEKAKETAETNDLEIVALHDKDSELAKQYGILFALPEPIVGIYRDKLKLGSYNGNDKMELPLSATYVIDKSGKITYAFLDADYKKRAEPAEVVAAVKAATVK